MTPTAQREILGNMGITPLVLRSREVTPPDLGVSPAVTKPDAVQPSSMPETQVVSAVESITPETPEVKADPAPNPSPLNK